MLEVEGDRRLACGFFPQTQRNRPDAEPLDRIECARSHYDSAATHIPYMYAAANYIYLCDFFDDTMRLT